MWSLIAVLVLKWWFSIARSESPGHFWHDLLILHDLLTPKEQTFSFQKLVALVQSSYVDIADVESKFAEVFNNMSSSIRLRNNNSL